MRRIAANISLTLFIAVSCAAQSPLFYLGFDHILDNREYFTPLAKHQTIFGARLNPGVSFSFDSIHSIKTGINYMYEYGGALTGIDPQIDLYYSYSARDLNLYFGSFPRKELVDYPLMLLTDSLNYYRPNMEGTSVRYSWGWGSVHGWVDWTGRATEETRESILAGIDASFRAGILDLTIITTRYHLARSEARFDRERIRDDGSIAVLAGIDLAGFIPLDRVDLKTGLVTTYERPRPAGYAFFHGWHTQLEVRKSLFGFKGTYYLGGSSPLLYGDPLFGSGNYGRADLFLDPFRNDRIKAKIGWNFHILPGDGLYHSQQVLIHVALGPLAR